ncbi:MAG: hypothetical protein JWQ93_2802 [Marmoricola sp.]|jgi:hypothetical protein|nr:hypothetical protein [Marmoricola sp.]
MTEKTPAPAKRRISRKKKVAVATVALIGVGGAAFAYWTAGGAGNDSASTATASQAVIIRQTSSVADIAPAETRSLSGTIDNPNAGQAYVTSITASIASVVDPTTGDPVTGCDKNDFVIGGLSGPYTAESGNTTPWSGLTITFTDTGVSQDACKGAKVNIAYVAS